MKRYVMSRIYDNFAEITELTADDLRKQGLRVGHRYTKSCDIYIDEFETEDEFKSFWNDCIAEGAKVVLL